MSLGRRSGVPVVSRVVLVCVLAVTAWMAARTDARGQAPLVSGRNVNMVAGTKWPDGDPYLQRQNEPSVAASTRNPLHLLAGANDYRSVDIPFVDNADETGDAWLGIFKSFDGGQRWRTSLLPGFPQDTSPAGMQSPLKGYQAGADPVVRAGTNGLLYYSGLVFDRTEDGSGRSAIFVARFVDNNDREAGDPIRYLGTSMVARSAGGATGAFLDKPWLAVDIPRGNAGVCRIVTTDVDPLTNETRQITQTVPAGPAYVAYTAFTRDAQGERADIYFTRSTNCGATWSTPIRVNRLEDRVNQGATLAIDPRDGDVFIAWRQFAPTAAAAGDGLMVARYQRASHRCLPPGLVRKLHSQKFANILQRIREKRRGGGAQSVGEELESFDQATTDISGSISFRTNAYPTMAIDANSRLYMAWTERGFGTARPSQVDGDARIVMATSGDGRTWTAPRAVADETTDDSQPIPGHQIMPTLTLGGGRLVLVYYDLRDDVSQQFSQFVDDRTALQSSPSRRRTLDLRASFAAPGANPDFAPSIRVSDYLVTQELTPAGTVAERQLQFNAPNLPMFKQGTAPFMGDYVDVTTVPAFVPTTNGRWTYNTAGQAVFHAVWTDNRDVRQPKDLNGDGNPWNDYAAPTQRAGGTSVFDGATTLPYCDPANPNTGSRNQNIYTARLSTGLIVGSPGNTKPLSSSLQRAFSVFAQNTTSQTKTFRMTIANQPPGGRASFDQFAAQPLLFVDVTTAPRSLAARTVYVTSSQPDAKVSVTVREIAGVGGAVMSGGLTDVIILNPDIANPDIANPDIANPDIANPDIANAEVYNPDIANPDIANPDIANPDIANPDIANPDIANPDIANPDIANPDIANVQVANPDIANPDIANPDIANPDIANPDIANPDIANPDIANTTLTDVSWTITNNGNTASSFNVNLFLAQATSKICGSGETPSNDGCIATQLVLHKVYSTPTATGCEVQVQTQNVLIANIPNPQFVVPGSGAPSANDPSVNNATLWLAPGESARITLRIADPNVNDNSTVGAGATIDPVFFPTTSGQGGVLTPFVTQQAINSTSIGAGGVVTRYPASVFFVQQPTTTPLGFPIAPAVSVQVRDQLGSPLANASVTMALQNPAPGGATVSGGDATVTDANGIAVFPALVADRAGVGYRLEVTVIDASTTVGSISNVSVAFDVPLAVVNVDDSGVGSLRFALEQSNLTMGLRETIVFAIPGAGPHTIAPASELPIIVDPVVVDARTQTGYAPLAPAVVVTGASIPGPMAGPALFDVTADNTELRGLFVRDSGASGIRVRGNGVQVRDNVISANLASGVLVQGGTGNSVASNVIGLSSGGLLPALPNTIGVEVTDSDGVPAEGTVVDANIVSGNSSVGILLRSAGGGPVNTAVTGNLVGLDVSGSIMAGNGNLAEQLGGVFVEAGPGTTVGAPGAGNNIGGNFGAGLTLGTQLPPSVASGITVVGNFVGTNDANISMGNTLGGVRVLNGSANLIGGDAQVAGTENIIRNNGGAGVAVIAGSGNTVRFNSISGNNGQGIDLGGDGVVNGNDGFDGDPGPNGFQNRPVLLWARNNVVPGATSVRGTFSSSPLTTFRIRIYSSAACDAGGFGEGEQQEDTLVVGTSATGGATFQQELAGPTVVGPLPLGRFVTVTATPLDGPDAGSTSEFSNCVPVEDLSGFEVSNTNDSGPGSLRQALSNANAAPDANVVTFAIPGASAASPAVIALVAPLPNITSPVSIDATTQPGWSPSFGFRPIVEVDGAGAGGSSLFNVYANNVSIHGLALTRSAGDGIFVLQGVSSASVRYNAIGTDRAGAAGKGNAGIGIRFRGHSGSIQTNVISGNGGPGVLFEDLGDGGSANDNTGDNNTVSDNVIGLNPDALAALPNANGIVMYDGTNNNTITSNTIGGNAGWGIDIQQSGALKAVEGTQILSNRIGVSPSSAPLPNGNGGVRLTDTIATIVGSSAGTANVIAFNGGPGVVISNGALGVSAANGVSSNSIHDNAGIGIDLGGDGVTPNDAGDGDTGPNGLQNAPALTASANVGTSSTTIDYSFSGAPNTQYALEFFTNAACDASGSGEGQTLAFTDLVTTDGAGNFNRSDWSVGGYFPYGTSFTGTARNSATGNTSEFSNCLPHVEPAAGLWSGTGSGIVTVLDAGSTGTPAMSYQHDGVGNFSGNWEFSRVAAGAGTINLAYNWSGFHSYFMVTTALEVFVMRGGVDVSVVPLAGQGPTSCDPCRSPSGGFAYNGATAVSVLAGDTYGLRLRGSHFDGTYVLQGTLRVSVDGTPAILSATPPTIAPGQMIVLRGSGLPATGAGGVLFKQGANPEVAATYTFYAEPTVVIARAPTTLTPGLPTTVRLTGGSTSTAEFPIAIDAVPSAPVPTALKSSCGGPDITTVSAGQQVAILADGVDTSGASFVWEPAAGTPLTSATDFTSGGPGSVCTTTTAPAGLTSGTWTLRIRTQVGPSVSPLSYHAIVVIVP